MCRGFRGKTQFKCPGQNSFFKKSVILFYSCGFSFIDEMLWEYLDQSISINLCSYEREVNKSFVKFK